jgi:Succinyl-CoA ligase like flavodoxin domain
VRARPGELHIRLLTSLTPAGRQCFDARERDAAVAAIAHVLRPASVLLTAAGPDSGLSSFVSMGAKADLSGNDLLQDWAADAGTDVVMLYRESFGNSRRFGQVARRVTAGKPVIAVKSGRAPAAPRPDSSQTGRLNRAPTLPRCATRCSASARWRSTIRSWRSSTAIRSSQARRARSSSTLARGWSRRSRSGPTRRSGADR